MAKMIKSKKEVELDERVAIQKYFDEVIVPSMPDYFVDYPPYFDGKPVTVCPLHDEDTPSFRYYDDTNSFYCFGCGKGGNIVMLHRLFQDRMNSVTQTYDEAVNFLYDYFVLGKDTKRLDTLTDKKSKINTDSEVVKLNIYRVGLEEMITADKSISLESKKEIWKALDEVDMLIDKDILKATDAESFIKAKLKEVIEKEARS